MELTQNYWDEYFAVYDALYEVVPYKELLHRIIAEAKIKPDDHILDAGAGTGNLEKLLREEGNTARVTGIDYSTSGLQIYKAKMPDSEVIETDLVHGLPFPNDFFDVVVANNTLYAIPPQKREEVIREFFRVMKPGGRIVISDPVRFFSAFSIYRGHVRSEIHEKGLLPTCAWILTSLVPTIEIFYKNYRLNRANKEGGDFFYDQKECHDALISAGFKSVLGPKSVYLGQAELYSGQKP